MTLGGGASPCLDPLNAQTQTLKTQRLAQRPEREGTLTGQGASALAPRAHSPDPD